MARTTMTLTRRSFRGRLSDGPLKDCKDRLVEILSGLPVLPERRESVDAEAATLLFVNLLCIGFDQTRPSQAQATAARKWLRHASSLALELQSTLMAAPRHALEAVSPSAPLMAKLEAFVREARAAQDYMPVKSGRPRHRSATLVTRQARNTYERLTGKRATTTTKDADTVSNVVSRRGGPFLDFLAEIFGLFEIEASAAHHAAALR
jgi:hypothetical protein